MFDQPDARSVEVAALDINQRQFRFGETDPTRK